MDSLPMFHFQVKIAARELEKVIAGLTMRVANHPDEVKFENFRGVIWDFEK